jgi:hypothetical protein
MQAAKLPAETAGNCASYNVLFFNHIQYRRPTYCIAACVCGTGATAGRVDAKNWYVKHVRPCANTPCTGKVEQKEPVNRLAVCLGSLHSCCCCFENFPSIAAVTCKNQHHWCPDCFEHCVACQVGGAGRPIFVASNCNIACNLCGPKPDAAFDMRICAPKLTQEIYGKYLTCLSEIAVIQTQNIWEKRLAEMKTNPNVDTDTQKTGTCL